MVFFFFCLLCDFLFAFLFISIFEKVSRHIDGKETVGSGDSFFFSFFLQQSFIYKTNVCGKPTKALNRKILIAFDLDNTEDDRYKTEVLLNCKDGNPNVQLRTLCGGDRLLSGQYINKHQ